MIDARTDPPPLPQLIGPLSLGIFLWNGHCTFNTQGTSIGLEYPMPQILEMIESAVDTSGVLSSWNQLATQQPVRSRVTSTLYLACAGASRCL